MIDTVIIFSAAAPVNTIAVALFITTLTVSGQAIRAASCTECGECEEKCPQKIEIRKALKDAHAALTR